LKPTYIYAKAVRAVLSHYVVKETVHAMANITGSGLPGNIPRTIPNGFVVKIKKGNWQVPPIFQLIQKHGDVVEGEMFDTFNMGIGMTIVCPAFNANAIQKILKDEGLGSDVIGKVEAGSDPAAEAYVIME
jgi:phosphoribosylformylglycinamidine cyclo-ligase